MGLPCSYGAAIAPYSPPLVSPLLCKVYGAKYKVIECIFHIRPQNLNWKFSFPILELWKTFESSQIARLANAKGKFDVKLFSAIFFEAFKAKPVCMILKHKSISTQSFAQCTYHQQIYANLWILRVSSNGGSFPMNSRRMDCFLSLVPPNDL